MPEIRKAGSPKGKVDKNDWKALAVEYGLLLLTVTLAFAGEQLIPFMESQGGKWATAAGIIGFVLMLVRKLLTKSPPPPKDDDGNDQW